MGNLVNILDPEEELGSQAPAEIDTVIDMLKMRKKPELIDKEIHVPFIRGPTERFLDGQVDQQLINRCQNTAESKVILDKNNLPLFAADQLSHGKRPFFGKISHEQLPHSLFTALLSRLTVPHRHSLQ